jgi:hypothetical protein
VARLESGFSSLQKKAWFQKPQEANKKTEGYHPSLEENLPKCSSIILKIFMAVVPDYYFF